MCAAALPSFRSTHINLAEPNAEGVGARAVFVAGLAGSGHKFWQEVFRQCVEARACRQVSSGGLKHSMLGPDSRIQEKVTTAWAAETWAAEGLDPTSRLLVLNSLDQDGLQTYPSGLSENSFPHVDALSKAAAENGASLRVILMLRDAHHLLNSAGELFHNPAFVLTRAARKLHEQLLTVPRENILCVKFAKLGKESVRDDVQEFLSNGAAVDGSPSFDFITSMSETWHGNSPSSCIGGRCHALQLARAIGKLNEFCGGGSSERAFPERLEQSEENLEDQDAQEALDEEQEETEEAEQEELLYEDEDEEEELSRVPSIRGSFDADGSGPASAAKIVGDVEAAANEASRSGDWLYGAALQ